MKNKAKRGAERAAAKAQAARPAEDRHVVLAKAAARVENEADPLADVSSLSPAATTSPAPEVKLVPAPAPALPLEEVAPAVTPSKAPPAEDPGARNHRRFPYEINVDIVSEHNFYAGLSLNISEGGLFVATHVEYPVGTKIEIRLLLPGDEEPTALMTEVRWVRPHHHDNADASAGGMGLRFVGLTPELLTKVARFAQARDPLYYDDE